MKPLAALANGFGANSAKSKLDYSPYGIQMVFISVPASNQLR